MSSKDASIPAVDYSGDYAAGSTTFLGGMQMQWTGEGATVQETEPKLRKLQLVAHKMSGKVPVSNELLADNAAGLEALLVRLFGYAVAFTEDYAFLMGDGMGKPLGVLNAAATITTATALTAASPTVAELSTMYKRLMPSSRGTAVWVVNTLLSDALMAMNSTGANVLTYLPNLQGRIEPRLFGLPVLETEKMPSTFADGGMLLADFQQYVIGSRQQIEIAMSEHVNFDTDETVWRCTARVEGQPWLNAPIKIGSGGNDTVSAFVKSK
jgi:HK97 family phage major capsid protein